MDAGYTRYGVMPVTEAGTFHSPHGRVTALWSLTK
jgi:hypothetical protein